MAHASQITRGLGDTIVAISSPRGSGFRGIVRLSGDRAVELAARGFEPDGHAKALTDLDWQTSDGRIVVGRAGVAAPVTVYVMRGPRSFTGEDQVELHLPGSPILLEMIVDVLRRSGARLATPGEFTQRAFLHGRIDLTQAEAVAATIHARSEGERIAAMGVLAGDRARMIESYGDRIADLLAAVELDLDFSDQDIDIVEPQGFCRSLITLARELQVMATKPGADRRTMSHRRILLVGPANAGKSSLFNALAGQDHAIVSQVRGTTRDFLETEIVVAKTHLVLVDTAGADHVGSKIDSEAHRLRTKEEDLAWHIVQVRCGTSWQFSAETDRNTTFLVSHADLVAPVERPDLGPRAIWFSAETGEGLDRIRNHLAALVVADDKGSDQALVHLDHRHREGFAGAAEALMRAADASQGGLGLELVAVDLHEARHCLRVLTGAEYSDEILDRIMRDFCIGK